jgi:riboflavin kinase / FMN adenylyltransferase
VNGSAAMPPAVVTVGTFDGVHRGHMRVLEKLCRVAGEYDARSLLVTFDPHPLRIVRPEAAPPLLTTPAEKMEILAQTAVERVVFLRFTPALAAYPPRRFVTDILIRRLACSTSSSATTTASGGPDR